MTIFISHALNFSSKPPMIITSFLNQANSFSHALQIYCLGLLGQNSILFRVQAKTGPYNLVFVLSLLVNDCILMYLETTILCIYNFLILYKCLFGFFFSPFILRPLLT